MDSTKKRLITNISLLLILATLGLLIWYQQSHQSDETPFIIQAKKNEMTRIAIEYPNKPVIQLQKQDDTWHITHPIHALANKVKLSHILTLASEKISASYTLDTEKQKEYGLDENAVSISFNDEKLTLGMANPISQNRYILKNGQVHLVTETMFTELSPQAGTYLSLQPFTETQRITKVNLPTPYTSNDETIKAWQHVSAIRVSDWDITQEKAQDAITIEFADDTKRVFNILATEPVFVLGDEQLKAKYQFLDEQMRKLLPKK